MLIKKYHLMKKKKKSKEKRKQMINILMEIIKIKKENIIILLIDLLLCKNILKFQHLFLFYNLSSKIDIFGPHYLFKSPISFNSVSVFFYYVISIDNFLF